MLEDVFGASGEQKTALHGCVTMLHATRKSSSNSINSMKTKRFALHKLPP